MPGLVPDLSPELSPVFARFMDHRSPVDVSRLGGAVRPELWDALVSEVGAAGLLVEEEHGGQGATLVELAAAVSEAGRCGWSGPLVATAGVAVALLGRVDPVDASGLRRGIAEDGRVVVAALHEDDAGSSLDAATVVRVVDGRTTARGRKTFVDSGTHADVLLLPAVDADGRPVLARVDAAAPGVVVEEMSAVDPGRGLAVVELRGAEVEVVAGGSDVPAALHDAWLTGALLVAVDALGAAGRAFALARDYSVQRQQFGRPVASFQSVKHKLVDMYAELQTASAAIAAALGAAAEGSADWRFAASAAAARGGDATMAVLRESVQVHGGIGFTWEHEVSHHFRRVTAERALYGTPARHRALVATEVGF